MRVALNLRIFTVNKFSTKCMKAAMFLQSVYTFRYEWEHLFLRNRFRCETGCRELSDSQCIRRLKPTPVITLGFLCRTNNNEWNLLSEFRVGKICNCLVIAWVTMKSIHWLVLGFFTGCRISTEYLWTCHELSSLQDFFQTKSLNSHTYVLRLSDREK